MLGCVEPSVGLASTGVAGDQLEHHSHSLMSMSLERT
jgi:hypothetical protein